VPPLTMRGRYLMREYWSDSDLFRRLDASERELYIGLWMLADDDGWLVRDVAGIAASLFRYEDSGPREARVRAGLRRLAQLGKLTSLRCGCLHLPAVERYPRAGKKSSEHRLIHDHHIRRGSKPPNDIQTDLNPSPVPTSRNHSLPNVARAPEERGATSAFDELMLANGLDKTRLRAVK
jgi:hypothetical protein